MKRKKSRAKEAYDEVMHIIGSDGSEKMAVVDGEHIRALCFEGRGIVVSAQDEVCGYYIIDKTREDILSPIGTVNDGGIRHHCFASPSKDGIYIFGILDWSLIMTVESGMPISGCEAPYPDEFKPELRRPWVQ